jgi:hypothetical protein
MSAEEKANPKPRLIIPAGALVILPLRNTVLFPTLSCRWLSAAQRASEL